MFKKILRWTTNKLKPVTLVDFMDAPILRAEEACIPCGRDVAIAPNFRSTREDEPIGVERLGEATVTGSHGWIRQRGIWMMQFSWYGGQTFLPTSYQVAPLKPHPPKHRHSIEGETITTIPCFDNVYGHVLIDELPMLLYLLQERRFEAYDTILCSGLAKKLISRITHSDLECFVSKMHPADRTTLYQVSSLTALRRNGSKTNPSRCELDLLRNAAQPVAIDTNTPKRIFLTRDSDTRSIENMSDVTKVLEAYDITPVSAGTHPNPWALFAQAEIVVGVAGSDLSDSAFMTSDSVLLEIHPSDHVKTYNWNVARTLGVTYLSMIAHSQILRGTPIGPGNSPIFVEPSILAEQLEKAVTSVQ